MAIKSNKRKKQAKEMSLPKLKKKAWEIFSRYVRIMNSNPDGFCECVTCGVAKHWKNMQAGHFVSGRTGRILFRIDNVHPQCYLCNCILSGCWPSYYRFMKEQYGQEKIEELITLAQMDKANPLSSSEIRERCNLVIATYGTGLKDMPEKWSGTWLK